MAASQGAAETCFLLAQENKALGIFESCKKHLLMGIEFAKRAYFGSSSMKTLGDSFFLLSGLPNLENVEASIECLQNALQYFKKGKEATSGKSNIAMASFCYDIAQTYYQLHYVKSPLSLPFL